MRRTRSNRRPDLFTGGAKILLLVFIFAGYATALSDLVTETGFGRIV
ncbi:MAG: hypothetical protein ACE5EM_01415 [Sphingomonadales bacterium]